MNLAKFQDIRSIHRKHLHFYILAMKNKKEKFRNLLLFFDLSFISALIFMISFLLLTFWVLFVLLSLVALNVRLDCLRFFSC